MEQAQQVADVIPLPLPRRCAVPDCIAPTGGAAMCEGHWFTLPWVLRNDAGAAWRPPVAVGQRWLRDALSVLVPHDGRSLPATRALSWAERAARPEALRVLDEHEPRPQRRSECRNGPRPCPYVSCASHLYLTVTEAGTLQFNFPGKDVDELEETCAEDVIERGPVSASRAGALVGIRRGRVGQMERAFRAELEEAGIGPR